MHIYFLLALLYYPSFVFGSDNSIVAENQTVSSIPEKLNDTSFCGLHWKMSEGAELKGIVSSSSFEDIIFENFDLDVNFVGCRFTDVIFKNCIFNIFFQRCTLENCMLLSKDSDATSAIIDTKSYNDLSLMDKIRVGCGTETSEAKSNWHYREKKVESDYITSCPIPVGGNGKSFYKNKKDYYGIDCADCLLIKVFFNKGCFVADFRNTALHLCVFLHVHFIKLFFEDCKFCDSRLIKFVIYNNIFSKQSKFKGIYGDCQELSSVFEEGYIYKKDLDILYQTLGEYKSTSGCGKKAVKGESRRTNINKEITEILQRYKRVLELAR